MIMEWFGKVGKILKNFNSLPIKNLISANKWLCALDCDVAEDAGCVESAVVVLVNSSQVQVYCKLIIRALGNN